MSSCIRCGHKGVGCSLSINTGTGPRDSTKMKRLSHEKHSKELYTCMDANSRALKALKRGNSGEAMEILKSLREATTSFGRFWLNSKVNESEHARRLRERRSKGQTKKERNEEMLENMRAFAGAEEEESKEEAQESE